MPNTEPPFALLISEIFPPVPGGSGRWLFEVYRRLPMRKLAIVAQTSSLPVGSDPDFVCRIPFDLTDTGGFTWRGLRGYRQLGRAIRAGVSDLPRPSVCQAARVLPEGWAAMLWRLRGGPKYQCFAHGEEINLDGARDGGVMSSRQHRWMARAVLQGADRVIANSQNTAAMLRQQWGVADEKIVVVHPGVDTDYFCPAPRCLETRHRLGWGNAPVLLSVGRLQRRKGHDQVIAALPQIRRSIPNALFAIAGRGEEESRLRQLALQHDVADAIRWHTDASDERVLTMYQQCDLFVLANRQIGSDVEGFGMVLLEAAACGKPTLAGKSGGTSEAIVDGQTGRLIDATDETVVADAIVSLLQDHVTAGNFGDAGRRRAVKEFDWSRLAGDVANLL